MLWIRGRRDSQSTPDLSCVGNHSPQQFFFFFFTNLAYLLARHEVIQGATSYPNQSDLGRTSGITTQAKFTTMVLLTILNPFLTREPRSTGFEGIATEICLIQHVQTKTNSMHARQDRVLGDVSWTRGPCQKHECRSQQENVHGFELPRERAAW